MKPEMLWQSEERQLQIKTGTHAPTDLIQEYLETHNGEIVTLTLVDGTQLRTILINAGRKALFLRTPLREKWLIIPVSKIVAIAVIDE